MAMLWTVWLACGGGSPQGALTEARTQLEASHWDAAVEAATEGLEARAGDAALRWDLELVRLEAQARAGRGPAVRQQLDRLAALYPPQVTAALYLATAAQLREGGDAASADELITAGAARFPEDEALGSAARAGAAPAPGVAGEGGEAGQGEQLAPALGAGPEGAGAEEAAAAGPGGATAP